jgi:TonB family protein
MFAEIVRRKRTLMSTNTIDPPISQLTPTRKPGETQRLQTLCIEVPVTVQGSRNTHPSTPFLEETRTVIVFPQGAVLRLSEIVVQGQIVIVQNMRVKQEVACRVISSKPGATAKGYVELEFTQPAPGFWGISFPGEAIAARPVVPEANSGSVTAPVVAASVNSASSASVQIVQPAMVGPVEPVESSAPVTPTSAPTNVPAKLTPETTLELNRAIAASFANLKEAVKRTEASETETPSIEKNEQAEKPAAQVHPTFAYEKKPAPAIETRTKPTSEPRPTSSTVAPPAQKPVMPPPSRNVAPPPALTPPNAPASAPMNSATKQPAAPQSVARSEARPQNISREPAPVALADAVTPSDVELRAKANQRTQAEPIRATKPNATKPSMEASDSRRASGVEQEGLTVLSDLGAAPDFGNQLLSAKAAENSRSGKKKMILMAAAAIVLAAGVGGYFWYAKTHAGSAILSAAGSASKPVTGAGVGGVTPNPTSPNATNSNVQQTPTSAPVSQTVNSRQPNNSAIVNPAAGNSNSQNTNNRAANKASNNLPPIVVNARQPNVLPMKIVAPTTPSRNASQNTVVAPEIGNTAPPAGSNTAGLGSITSSSMSAAPPPPPGVSSSPSVVKEAKLLISIPPVYPKAAVVRGDSGVVTVEATVNEQGRVIAAKATSGPMTLRTAAVDAVSQWKYQAATLNGKPVQSQVTVRLSFNPKK